MAVDGIGHSLVMIAEKYSKFSFKKLIDYFLSLKERIVLRLVPPTEYSSLTY